MYTTVKTLSNIRQVDLFRKKEFIAIALDPEDKTFIIYLASLTNSDIHFSHEAQIALLKINETFITVFLKYSNFTDVFSPKLAVKLPEYTNINNHIIDLIDNKQPLYELFYNLESVKLKILKMYIKTNLVNYFISSFKSFTSTLILFI